VAKCFAIAFNIISHRAVTWTNQVIQDLSKRINQEYTSRGYKTEKKSSIVSYFNYEYQRYQRYQSTMKLRVTKGN